MVRSPPMRPRTSVSRYSVTALFSFQMKSPFYKFPGTPHLEGSRLQPGDEDLSHIPFGAIRGREVVVTEKLDGTNIGVSFAETGEVRLQSRGGFIYGGGRERHLGHLKAWLAVNREALAQALGSRYVMYVEALYAKHTIFYDRLPSYLIILDVLDTTNLRFLDSTSRRQLLRGVPVVEAPILFCGRLNTVEDLKNLTGSSVYCTSRPRDAFVAACNEAGIECSKAEPQTDVSGVAEGLYLKVEAAGWVEARVKWVRASFLTGTAAQSHWLDRPLIPNRLAPEAEPFGPEIGTDAGPHLES